MKFYSIFFLLFQQLFIAQQIKVEYLEVRSNIATAKESLYIKDSKAISIKDSLINFKYPDSPTHKVENTNFAAMYFSDVLKNNESKDFNFTTRFDDSKDIIYLVNDPVSAIQWTIDQQSTKHILQYKCYRATADFRGRQIEVYFTKDLPYSVGPFKFYGLPGLILEAKVVGLGYYIWKAVSIDLKNKDNVNYHPPLDNINIIDIKEYVRLYDEKKRQFSKNIPTNRSIGGTATGSTERLSLEKTYDWE